MAVTQTFADGSYTQTFEDGSTVTMDAEGNFTSTPATKPEGDYSWSEPESEASVDNPPVYPYNNVTQTASGHTFEMDDTRGRERIRLQHGGAKTGGQGSFFEMQSNGDKVEKIIGKNYQIVAKDNNVLISGVCNITIEGDSVVHVKGDKFERIDGDYVQEVRGRYTQNLKGKANIICSDDMVMGVGTPGLGSLRLSVGDHLYLDSDLEVAGSLTADMVTAETKVNAGTGMTAGPLGFATLLGGVSAGLPVAVPGLVNALVSVNAPLINGVIVKDIQGTMMGMRMIYNFHKHPAPKGITGLPIKPML
jgi:hypothetical protein